MSKKNIPDNVRAEVDAIVDKFNRTVLQAPNNGYTTRYRGKFAYFDQPSPSGPSPTFRLKYTGEMEGWEFAIYKYSDDRYDPDEWFFPGSEHIDGTVEGALQAGLAAYPLNAAYQAMGELGLLDALQELVGEMVETMVIYQLKITLQGIAPPVWRRVLVSSDDTLDDLHNIIQIVMPWDDTHLSHFIQGDKYFSSATADLGVEYYPSVMVLLEEVLKKPGDSIVYEYDFGDSWRHVVELEEIQNVSIGMMYPRCIGGERACPPEDSGGPPGYQFMLAALADPKHPQHEMYASQIDEAFDPEVFDIDAANDELKLFLLDDVFDEIGEDSFPTLNRTVVVVKSRQPLVDWANNLPDQVDVTITLDRANEDATSVLIPKFEDEIEYREYLRMLKLYLFEMELSGWWLDPDEWPQERTVELFDEWFELEIHTLVYDFASDAPLLYNEW